METWNGKKLTTTYSPLKTLMFIEYVKVYFGSPLSGQFKSGPKLYYKRKT
jgi:hypothetical protein